MLPFPSIKPFKSVIKAVSLKTAYQGKDEAGLPIYSSNCLKPKLNYIGTVKLHGSNAAIVQYKAGEDFKIQSRSQEINIQYDNYGFAKMIREEKTQEYCFDLFKKIRKLLSLSDDEVVAIYGEVCGSNVQKKVALSKLNKMFVVFAIKIGNQSKDYRWVNPQQMQLLSLDKTYNFYNSYHFPIFKMEIDFNNPLQSTNTLINLTEQVEKECPVGKSFNVSGIGEGIVWRPIDYDYQDSEYWFKVKGKEHSSTKVKTLVEVDMELVKSTEEFANIVLTDSRLHQGLDYLKEVGLEFSIKNLGEYLRWIVKDVIKEESDRMIESGLELKSVCKILSAKARVWFLNNI